MAGGSLFSNPRLAMPVFVIPPECYALSMDLSNIFRRAVHMLW